MTMELFSNLIKTQLDYMIDQSVDLFYVEAGRNELFDLYIRSFPPHFNPLYRERTVHDCASCKNFIRRAGHVVAIINNQIVTIWDIGTEKLEPEYRVVAEAMAHRVRNGVIAGVYRQKDRVLGSKPNRETLDGGIVNIYNHFHYELPGEFVFQDIGTLRSRLTANYEVLKRSMETISLEAAEVVLDLIRENQIYRGAEKKHVVENFVETRREYDEVPNVELFLWVRSVQLKESGRFRNDAIGTLLVDLSEGTPLEDAVRKFETMVAPQNYKRTTALVTQAMIDRAQETVKELGIEDSLHRRFARAKDLTSNNLLFVDKGTKKKLKDKGKNKGVFADLEPTASPVSSDNVQKVDVEEFMRSILPYAEGMEIMVENRHMNRFVSVIAPEKPRSPNIMKWSNPFSWSYAGEVTDSIKERVKKAGGNVEGFMRASLSWSNYDDLDLHCIEPSGEEIYFSHMKSRRTGGWLDVDMNAGGRMTREPVENISWADESKLLEGTYKIFVHQYSKRESQDVGFEAQVEINGQLYEFSYDQALRQGERVPVMQFTYSRDKGVQTNASLTPNTATQTMWGVDTHTWTKVNMVLLSPNFWNGEQIGNKHWFFILDGCQNPEKARGFYNEFLMNELREHRKVFELLASKMRAEPTDDQLSGIGFSSTQTGRLLVRVTGKFEKVYELTFAPERMIEEPDRRLFQIEGLCEVCKKVVTTLDSRLPCPHCDRVYHTAHFLEWVRIKGKCPACRGSVSQVMVAKIVELPTV